MKLLGRFLRLSRRDQLLLLRAASLIVFTRMGLRLSNVQTMGRLLEGHHTRPNQIAAPDEERVAQVVWAVEVAGHYLTHDKPCLTKALVAQRLLWEAGHPSTLCIGFRRTASGQVAAHAWLENQGVILIGHLDNLDEYASVPALSQLAE